MWLILIAECTETTKSPITWGHSIERYSGLLTPSEPVKHEPRKVEDITDCYFGEIMKFEKAKERYSQSIVLGSNSFFEECG
jgi:hypothetical protein